MDSRPPPPPHGANTNANANNARSSHLPPGNYDIFVIPPHSAGSGFLYLPSLQPHRNSFLAGVASTLVVVGIWATVIPAIKHWASSVAASGGMAVFMLVIAVGVLGWAFGKTQLENTTQPPPGSTGTGGHQHSHAGPPPFASAGANAGSGAGAKPSWQRATPNGPSTGWEKARAETKKREEEKRKNDEAEKEKVKAREREAREKAAREKIAQERMRRENEAKANKEKEPAKAAAHAAGTKNYKKPTAQSYAGDEDEFSYRPYDKHKHPKQQDSQSSFVSESSGAPSQSTARTTPPPSNRGPYSNKDPDKISIKAVYAFTDAAPKPVAQLVSGAGSVTDGLVLKMTTEGLFIDDDVRGVGQREWDIKAWTLKLVEVCCPQFASRAGPATLPARYSAKAKDPVHRFFAEENNTGNKLSSEELDRVIEELLRTCKSGCASNSSSSSQTGDLKGRHVLKASIRDAENKKYYFIIDAVESWKVAVGLQRLRRGSQVRSLGVSGLSTSETKGILLSLGWLRE